jgi:hypothetical protein
VEETGWIWDGTGLKTGHVPLSFSPQPSLLFLSPAHQPQAHKDVHKIVHVARA